MILALLPVVLLLLLLIWVLYRQASQIHQLRVEMMQLVRSEVRGLFTQLESYHFLLNRLGLNKGLPYSRDWSAAPDFLKLIAEHALTQHPVTIVECSSGMTSLVLARCSELNGHGHLYSLENGAEYAERSREALEHYNLGWRASVIDAPLERYALGGETYQWYSLAGLPETGIEMLVIDGPPGFIQRHSRYPALPLLYDRLADGCVIFLDDAARQDEQEIVARWLAEFPGLQHQYFKNERGCSMLTVSKGA